MCIYIYIYIDVYECVHIHIYIYIYIHIHIFYAFSYALKYIPGASCCQRKVEMETARTQPVDSDEPGEGSSLSPQQKEAQLLDRVFGGA